MEFYAFDLDNWFQGDTRFSRFLLLQQEYNNLSQTTLEELSLKPI